MTAGPVLTSHREATERSLHVWNRNLRQCNGEISAPQMCSRVVYIMLLSWSRPWCVILICGRFLPWGCNRCESFTTLLWCEAYSRGNRDISRNRNIPTPLCEHSYIRGTARKPLASGHLHGHSPIRDILPRRGIPTSSGTSLHHRGHPYIIGDIPFASATSPLASGTSSRVGASLHHREHPSRRGIPTSFGDIPLAGISLSHQGRPLA